MCRIRNCKRHVFDHTLCLTHLREATDAGIEYNEVASWQPKDTRNKRIDAIEVVTADAPVELEERNDTNE